METTDLAALTATNVVGLTTSQVQALSSTQLQGFNSVQLRALSSVQIRAIETSDIVALSSTQMAAIKSKWGNSYPYSDGQVEALLDSGKALNSITPLVIDLDGNGVSTVSVSAGTLFDLDKDGKRDQTGWVSAGDGLLVRDLNSDGQISDGSELFGSFTSLNDGSQARDGYEALKSLDSNGDGYVDSSDEAFVRLKVWRDADGDAVTDEGELLGLQDLGISRLGTAPTVDVKQDQGNIIGLVSDVVREDGGTSEMADVWFQANLTDQDAIVEAMDDVLARYSAEVPHGGDGSLPVGVNVENQTQDVSLALSSELTLFDQAGSQVDLTKGLNLVSASDPTGVTDPEELLKRQQGPSSGTLGQT
jgi:hypothetical protein